MGDKRPKRGHGEGQIYQRDDGVWVGRVMLGRRATGKPDRQRVYGRTRAEVLRQIRELRKKADEGTHVEASKERQTVAAYMDTWLSAARTSTRPQTWNGYCQVAHKHIAPALGHIKLLELRPDAIQSLYADKLAVGLAPGTVTKIHIVLHRALEMAVKWRYIQRNPADDVDRPAVPRRDMRALDPDELGRLVETAQATNDRLATLWLLAAHTGCREGELLGLSWDDLDLERGTLTVRRTLVSTHGQAPRFGEPKSQTSRRTLSLPPDAVDTLRAHKAKQNEERLKAHEWADYRLVFCSQFGTPLLRRNVLRAFKLALRRAGLPESVRFHDLRHAHATLLLRAGVPLKTASSRLGHSGIGITADLYQHIASDLDVDAAERVGKLLRRV